MIVLMIGTMIVMIMKMFVMMVKTDELFQPAGKSGPAGDFKIFCFEQKMEKNVLAAG